MRKLFLIILVCFASIHSFAQNYMDADSVAMAKADSCVNLVLKSYQENDVFDRYWDFFSEVYPQLKEHDED